MLFYSKFFNTVTVPNLQYSPTLFLISTLPFSQQTDLIASDLESDAVMYDSSKTRFE